LVGKKKKFRQEEKRGKGEQLPELKKLGSIGCHRGTGPKRVGERGKTTANETSGWRLRGRHPTHKGKEEGVPALMLTGGGCT